MQLYLGISVYSQTVKKLFQKSDLENRVVDVCSWKLYGPLKAVDLTLCWTNLLGWKVTLPWKYKKNRSHSGASGFANSLAILFFLPSFLSFIIGPTARGNFPGQGLNPHPNCNLSHSSDNTGSLTHWATRELFPCCSSNPQNLKSVFLAFQICGRLFNNSSLCVAYFISYFSIFDCVPKETNKNKGRLERT